MNVCRVGLAVVVAGAMGAGGCVAPIKSASSDTPQVRRDRVSLAEFTVGGWSSFSALAARSLMERYGAPDGVRSGYLVWNDVGPWKRVTVRNSWPTRADSPDADIIEESIVYPLTGEQAARVAAMGPGLTYDARGQLLSAASDREELNYLRLNLADDVAAGRASVAEARELYSKILTLEQSGKSSPYLSSLLPLEERLDAPWATKVVALPEPR